MRQNSTSILMVCVVLLSLLLTRCGVRDVATNSGSSVLKGVAASGAAIAGGTVTLTDASTTPQVKTTTTASNGSFSFNVSGFTPPFMLGVQWADSTGTNRLFSLAQGPGTANINPFSNAAFAAAANTSNPSALETSPNPAAFRVAAANHGEVIDSLMSMLAPLFELYGTAKNPVYDDYEADHTGLDAMFDDVKITVSNDMIIVTSKEMGAVIFQAPINDIPSGSLDENNMPHPGQVTGAALYATYCASCHGPLAASSKLGVTSSQIQAATLSVSAMSSLLTLTAGQVQAIASALSSTPTPTPGTCTYTYSAWGACQSNNTQTRTVLSSSSAGCIGTPLLSQACTYAPSTTLTLAQATTTCTMCHGLKVNTTVLKSGGYAVTGRTSAQWLTTVNTMVGYGTSLAAGTMAQDYANFLATLP